MTVIRLAERGAKADVVSLPCIYPLPPTPEQLCREAVLLAQWRRGVPPAEVLLTVADKQWLRDMQDPETAKVAVQ